MCLILIAYRTRADRPLVVAANRDEYHRRPGRSIRFRETTPQVLAGQDRRPLQEAVWSETFWKAQAAARTHAESPSRERNRYNGPLPAAGRMLYPAGGPGWTGPHQR